jgi:hypothetical protein
MSDKTLRWKLFPFSLTGRAKHWYSQTVGSMQRDWEMLCSKFCLRFFPISRVVSLRKEILNFRQLEEESLAASWDHFYDLIITGPDLATQDPVLLQYFYMGLSKDSMQSLDQASRGTFLHLSASEARSMLDRISGKTPCTSIHNELHEEEKKSSPKQEVLISKSEPLQSQDLAINPEPSRIQILQKKKKFNLLKFLLRMVFFRLILGKA